MSSKKTNFENDLLLNLTRRAVGTSAMRNQGAKGLIESIQSFLAAIPLTKLSALRTELDFVKWLEQQTVDLKDEYNEKYGLEWGTARKALNLWLRDIVYNHHLRAKYHLQKLEPWLEVPLDSHTGKFIRERTGPKPERWTTVKGLQPDVSRTYQNSAKEIVTRKEYSYLKHRVHLDLIAWRKSGKTPTPNT